MSGVMAAVSENVAEGIKGAGRLAAAIARPAIVGGLIVTVAALSSTSSFAQQKTAELAPGAQVRTIAVTPNAVDGPSKEVCHTAMLAFEKYVTKNLGKFSTDDKRQLGLLNQWIGAGCQGTLKLKAGLPEVQATLTELQTFVGRKYDFNKVITLG
ncbi:MAG: hypothetical protein K2Q32_08460 [Alphaproteobacteria bacterium]|nr:hypothetical protein [Alphaproteobacteria bacterium]